MIEASLVDGRAELLPAADNRGLAFGDGVFRTLLVADGAVVHIDDHLAALAADAARLELDLPQADVLRAESAQLAAGQARAVLKWLLLRRNEGRGYRATTSATQRIVLRSAAPRYAQACWTEG
ncbi:MAG: aminodeoxychorismate lyase, partial [Solimonas sp.]